MNRFLPAQVAVLAFLLTFVFAVTSAMAASDRDEAGLAVAAEPTKAVATASSNAAAAATAESQPKPGQNLGSGPAEILNAGQLVKVVVALVITVIAILALSAFAKKARWGRSPEGQHLRVIDSLAVGARDRIMLVAVDDQRIVVAATPGQMRALHTFNEPKIASFEQAMHESLDLVKGAPQA